MKPIRWTNESGMTLMELMLASGVMAVSLTFLFGSLLTISAAGDITANRTIAVTHVSTVMEQVRTLTYDELLAYQPPVFVGLGMSETVHVEYYQADGTTVVPPIAPGALANPLPNPLTVKCTVTWYDPRGHAFRQVGSEMVYR